MALFPLNDGWTGAIRRMIEERQRFLRFHARNTMTTALSSAPICQEPAHVFRNGWQGQQPGSHPQDAEGEHDRKD